MRRTAGVVFLGAFWLLGLCTFLSLRIEVLMTPLVVTTAMPTNPNIKVPRISGQSLFWEEDGPHLYWVEGSGWESGTARIADAGTYYPSGEDLSVPYGVRYIRYAQKPPVADRTVFLSGPRQKGKDRWLVMDAALPAGAGEGLSLLGEAPGAALVEATEQPQPFMEKQAKQVLGLSEPEGHVVSLGDLARTTAQLPLLGLLTGATVFAALGMAALWRLAKHPKVNRKRLVALGLLLAGLFLLSAWAILRLDPSPSLLPRENVLDLAHYHRELSGAIAALRSLGESGCAPARDFLGQAAGETALFWSLLCAGAGAGYVLLRRQKKRP